MKFINGTDKILIIQYANGPCGSKTFVLHHPEGSAEIPLVEIAGAIYLHDTTPEELEKIKKRWKKDNHKFKECK
jgi:hypothetical protein